MMVEEEYRDVGAAAVAFSHGQFASGAAVDAGAGVGGHFALRPERFHRFADNAQGVGVGSRVIHDAQGVLDALLSKDISCQGQSHADGIPERGRLHLGNAGKLNGKSRIRVCIRLPLLGVCRAGHQQTRQ
jgi:hypothetical protein